MVKIIIQNEFGDTQSIEADKKKTLMEALVDHNIPGITADCGGACACATCHIYVDHETLSKLEKPSEMEEAMLEFADHVTDSSRLSCQIQIEGVAEGMVITLPPV